MDYTKFVSDLPEQHRIVFGSPEENEETLNHLGVSQTVRQIGKGPFRSDLIVNCNPQADFFADRFNTAVSIGLTLPAGQVGLLFPRSASGEFRVAGRDAGNNKLIVFSGGEEVDIFVPDLAGSEGVAIKASKFESLVEALFPEQTAARRAQLSVVKGDTKQLKKLRLATLEAVKGGLIASGKGYIENLLAGLVAWIGESRNFPNPALSSTRAARVRAAKLAQEYIEENHRNPIRIDAICRLTNTGVRTLQRCFLNQFGITISEYLKTVRLAAIRRHLTIAQPGTDTVAKIAISHGIHHFGRLSAQYWERYGELPSNTRNLLSAKG